MYMLYLCMYTLGVLHVHVHVYTYTMAGLMECVVYASIVYMNYSSFWVILHVYIHFSNLTITTVLILLYIIHIYMYVPTA